MSFALVVGLIFGRGRRQANSIPAVSRIRDHLTVLPGWGTARMVDGIEKLQQVLDEVGDDVWLDAAARQIDQFVAKGKFPDGFETGDTLGQKTAWQSGYVFGLPCGCEAAVLLPAKGSNLMVGVFVRGTASSEDELDEELVLLVRNFGIAIED